MKTVVYRLAALKIKSFVYGKIPFPKEARVDRRHAYRSCVGGSDLSADRAHLRNGILQGSFPAGTPFLGSREIARELGCSRTVILTAWDLLYAASSVRGAMWP